MSTRIRLLLTALVVVASAVWGVQLSSATYTGGSSHTTSVSALPDWAAPIVAVTSPGAIVAGAAVAVNATATDIDGSGVASVRLQYSVADQNQWVTLCTDTSAPYSCTWNTTLVPDGRYDLRATAVDNAGFTATSSLVPVRVVNNLSVVLADLPSVTPGPLTLTASLANNGTVTATRLYVEYAPAGTTSWTAVPGCARQTTAGTFTTRTCTWTPPLGTEASYDFRAVAETSVGTKYDVQPDVTIDNQVPTGTLTVPGSPLRGVVTLSAVAADATEEGSGVDTVTFQLRPAGGVWTSCGSSTTEPYACRLDTSALANGSHEFRIVVTDVAGNTFTSAGQTRTVDNTQATTSITAPIDGSTVTGAAVAVTAAASSTLGIQSVRIDVSSDGTTWYPLCTDASAPYSCSWDTTAILGSQQMFLRSVATQTGGQFLTSETVSVTVDNTPLKGLDVQAWNSGTAGRVTTGDTFELTYSTTVDLGSVRAGWTGEPTTITATLRDGTVTDQMVFGANLGSVALGGNFVQKRDATFTATMTASTSTVAGTDVTVITVVIGAQTGGGTVRTVKGGKTLVWTPSALVRTPTGIACSTAAVRESGTLDRDL